MNIGEGLNGGEGDDKTTAKGFDEGIDTRTRFLRFGRCEWVAHGTQWSPTAVTQGSSAGLTARRHYKLPPAKMMRAWGTTRHGGFDDVDNDAHRRWRNRRNPEATTIGLDLQIRHDNSDLGLGA